MARSTYIELGNGQVVRVGDVSPDQPIEFIDPTTGEQKTLPAEIALTFMAEQAQTRGPLETVGGRRSRPVGIMSSLGQMYGINAGREMGMATRRQGQPITAANQAGAANTAMGLAKDEKARAMRAVLGIGEYSESKGFGKGLSQQAQGTGLAVAPGRMNAFSPQTRQAPGGSARINPAFTEFQQGIVSPNVAMGNIAAAAAAGDPAALQTMQDLEELGWDPGDIGSAPAGAGDGGVGATPDAPGGVADTEHTGGQSIGYDPSETGGGPDSGGDK